MSDFQELKEKFFSIKDYILGVMEIQALIVKCVLIDGIRLRRDDGKASQKLHRLMKHIFKACVIGVVIIGIERQNRACDLVHDRARGSFHNYILGKSGGETAVSRKDVIKLIKL